MRVVNISVFGESPTIVGCVMFGVGIFVVVVVVVVKGSSSKAEVVVAISQSNKEA